MIVQPSMNKGNFISYFHPQLYIKQFFFYYLYRLTSAHISPRFDYRNQETQAGRKFLQTLRKHDDEIENNDETKKNYEKINPIEKKDNLRASLERLIVEYLKKLTSDDRESFEDNPRNRRNLNNLTSLQPIKSDSENLINKTDSEVEERIEIGVRNITVTESVDSNEEKINMLYEQTMCSERKRRIAQLDRFELEDALRNETDNEHNIRRILNYR